MNKDDKNCTYYLVSGGAIAFWIIVALIIALVMCYSSESEAAVLIGAGPNCGTPRGDGAWQQEGQPYTFDRCGYNAVVQHEGRTGLKFLAPITYRAGLAYRKGIKVTDGEWVTDYCYGNKIFSGGECGRRYNSKSVEDTTRAFTLSVGPEWITGKFKTSLHLGLSHNNSVTRVEWDQSKGVCSTDDCGGTQYWRKTTTSPCLELSTSYKRIFATLYYVQRDQGLESAQIGAYGLSVGYRF